MDRCGSCWEIALNSNCDLKSQSGFLIEEGKINLGFLVVDGKGYILVRKESLFLVKEVMYS